MISIVIPAWNKHEMTAECIEAVKAHTQDFEIVLVDNGSDPPLGGVAVRNESNLGFPVAVNQGIRAAKGDVIVLLNNDVICTPGWAERLLRGLESFSIVGPMTNYCSGMQATMIGAYRDQEELDREASVWGDKHGGKVIEVNWIIGFLMAFPRSLFDELGPFDESMWPGSGEEIDFCFRARAAGRRVGIAFDAYVHHIGSQTFQEMHNKKILDFGDHCKKVEDHIGKKWGKDYWYRQAVAEGEG